MSTLGTRVGRWAPRLSASIADQGAGAVTHLALHVALARLLEPPAYGVFALTFALLLFLMGAHQALVAEPMTVLGPARHSASLQGYVRATIRLQTRVAALAAGAAVIIGLVVVPWSAPLGLAFLSLVTTAPAYLTFMLLRRACYTLSRPGDALFGSLLYALVVLGGLVIMNAWGRLSLVGALGLMALGALVAAGTMFGRLDLPEKGAARPIPKVLWRQNWHYGRWILAANLAHWGGTGIYLFMVGALAGLAEAGVFRAVQTLVSPAQQVLVGLGLLALPWLAGRRAQDRGAGADLAPVLRIWAPAVALVGVYGVAVSVWGEPITRFVYGREEYTRAAGLLPVFAVFVVLAGVAQGLTLALRSSERSEPVFWSKLAASGVALVPGLALTWQWGLAGAAWGMALSVAAEGTVLVAALGRRQQ